MSYKQYKHLIAVNYAGIRDKIKPQKKYGKTKAKSTRGQKKSFAR